jgi:CHAT domain-containing protein
MKQLKEIGEFLLGPILDEGRSIGACPEGILWSVPWLACLDAMGVERDLELRLHPGLRGGTPTVSERPTMLWVAAHPDLPQAQEEANQFLAQHPDASVCRSASEVRTVMGTASVGLLHVISHARHRASHPMFSTLDFTDGPVFAAEIARSGLRAELVTLSGCDTGRISGENSLEPDGLVRAFLACGAGYVVGSAWPLDDEAAMRFYSAFFRIFASTSDIHNSLRAARSTVREWKDHPYYWAFPLLFAGYRS